MTLEAFQADVASAAAGSAIVVGLSTVDSGVTFVHLRAHLAGGSFVDAFYNEATGKTAFAWIRANRRVFGADNTGGWHWHPFQNAERHVARASPISFAEFLTKIKPLL